jgi:hypothetical protein
VAGKSALPWGPAHRSSPVAAKINFLTSSKERKEKVKNNSHHPVMFLPYSLHG